MTGKKMIRLSQAARKMNIGTSTIVEKLAAKGIEVDSDPNTKITHDQYNLLAEEIGVPQLDAGKSKNKTVKPPEKEVKQEEKITEKVVEEVTQKKEEKVEKAPTSDLHKFKVLGKIELDKPKKTNPNPESKKETKKTTQQKPVEKKVSETPKKQEKVSTKTTEKPKVEQEVVAQQETEKKAEIKETNKQETVNKTDEVKDKPKTDKKLIIQEDKKTNTPASKAMKTETIEKTPSVSNKDKKDAMPQNNHKTEETSKKENDKPEILKKEDAPVSESKTQKDNPKPDKKEVIKGGAIDSKDKTEDKTTEEGNQEKDMELIKAKGKQLKGLTVLRKIELPEERSRRKSKPVASSDDKDNKKRKRKKKRIKRDGTPDNSGSNNNNANNSNSSNNSNRNNNRNNNNQRSRNQQGQNNNQNRNNRNRKRGKRQENKTVEVSDKQIQEQIKATLAKLSNKGGKSANRRNRTSKSKDRDSQTEENQIATLKVTEFISANDLASLMDVSVTEVISKAMGMGMFVSINQRLDAEAITFIADEFDYQVEFISAEEDDKLIEEEIEDAEEDLELRAPIVTIMGHVDHGKTSLLDYIRKSNVTSQESGGITQHIGAYDVKTKNGQRIAFLDTPGHEAFTAMRARGAKVTDIVILVVAADDNVMPQTKEAINHAQQAGVPIVIAINKIDKPTANPNKIREELATENILVESWGGKYQDQEISAKAGTGIDELLEKVLLEAEVLELKANPERNANGTVIEAFLDKGKGYVATVLVQAGTLRVGDIILAGAHYGRVKAMNDHLGNKVEEAPPSTPVQVLGLDGAPQSGDVLKVIDNEREAREIATKRGQIMREQNIRATRGLTLEEIGRRRALGDFKELKIIIKGDVDGSVEALSDSLLKLSTPEIEVKIIHKAVGQISEADIMLASASEAIIVGFQVRPSANARKAAEQEKVQIKLYSIIYNAINEVQDAMEGMLAPKVEEVIVGNVEVREIFKISRIGTVAGCYVTDGYIHRKNKIRLIRDGIVTYEGEIGALKRFKDDVQEVKSNFECGLSIQNFNDIKVGDVVESYEQREIKRTLT